MGGARRSAPGPAHCHFQRTASRFPTRPRPRSCCPTPLQLVPGPAHLACPRSRGGTAPPPSAGLAGKRRRRRAGRPKGSDPLSSAPPALPFRARAPALWQPYHTANCGAPTRHCRCALRILYSPFPCRTLRGNPAHPAGLRRSLGHLPPARAARPHRWRTRPCRELRPAALASHALMLLPKLALASAAAATFHAACKCGSRAPGRGGFCGCGQRQGGGRRGGWRQLSGATGQLGGGRAGRLPTKPVARWAVRRCSPRSLRVREALLIRWLVLKARVKARSGPRGPPQTARPTSRRPAHEAKGRSAPQPRAPLAVQPRAPLAVQAGRRAPLRARAAPLARAARMAGAYSGSLYLAAGAGGAAGAAADAAAHGRRLLASARVFGLGAGVFLLGLFL
jgi:hypothetical protein